METQKITTLFGFFPPHMIFLSNPSLYLLFTSTSCLLPFWWLKVISFQLHTCWKFHHQRLVSHIRIDTFASCVLLRISLLHSTSDMDGSIMIFYMLHGLASWKIHNHPHKESYRQDPSNPRQKHLCLKPRESMI